MKYLYYCAALLLAAVSCSTVDIEKLAGQAGAGSRPRSGEKTAVLAVPVEDPVYVEVEKPVYIPEKDRGAAPYVPKGRLAVTASNSQGIKAPSDYSHAAMVYDYNADWVYEIYTQPLRVSDIRLEPGENAVESPFVSDSERWMLGAGVSREEGRTVQHIYVKPGGTKLSITASSEIP